MANGFHCSRCYFIALALHVGNLLPKRQQGARSRAPWQLLRFPDSWRVPGLRRCPAGLHANAIHRIACENWRDTLISPLKQIHQEKVAHDRSSLKAQEAGKPKALILMRSWRACMPQYQLGWGMKIALMCRQMPKKIIFMRLNKIVGVTWPITP